ncbi:TRAP transporter fused permease subunit [Actinosynnema sp. NPDC047251]|uniref:TRAP transporter, 4TM/12TM fusion protein n=1 Tax=Saccharothrix espanaensis (strain ATCC 51144 / DSM 44229 / JCM 9112 / NBRC 15066 / NRRL 15764) TaxID=1179773 RepID=K0KD59_SACES|nr:TRAP transporter fused permease subunit [Saccharothrix espanaensis]CCH35502.1 TRAP transporter, 4TM/12TM fusion protein [Saccharothrix espanaensis DSM 44229]
MSTKPQADVSELIAEYDEERPSRVLSRQWESGVWAATLGVALLVLKQVFWPFAKGGQYYLVIFLAVTLPLVFLCYRGWRGGNDPHVVDWVLAGLAFVVGAYPLFGGFDAFLDRQGQLTDLDVVAGSVLLLLVLEACRRTTGWVLPVVCIGFIAFAYYGGYLPPSWAISHAGVDFGQIINGFYNDATGFYGTPLDVAATYIVLFTIYGSVLNASGAGAFFVDISFSAFRKSRTAPGRTAATAGFLLGTVSGSGTATTVSLGAVTWPMLKKAGYPKENAGGLLAASGIGAILSPPTLGAAAFIIAEYLETSYLQVLAWAILPTLLYYLGIALAVEVDARRFGAKPVEVDVPGPWVLLRRGGYHFLSLAVIVVFLALDIPVYSAVVYATGVAAVFALVARRGDVRGWARAMVDSLALGVRSALPVIAVCAAAGVITSTITKTGLGQELASALVEVAGFASSDPAVVLFVTVVLAAVAVSVLGLAVPVTASFIISWVVIGPALIELGVAREEAAMFIFYYAVLSEVTPPTALAAVAAAAITGGDVMKTMWRTWKYTLPAFLVPLAFVLTDSGAGLLLRASVGDVLWAFGVSVVGVAALAVLTGGWMFGPARWPERLLCLPAAILLLFLQGWSVVVGVGFLLAAVGVHLLLPKVLVRGRERDA